MGAPSPQIRLTGLLVERGRLLVVRQSCRASEHWNLPGGRLEEGETIADGLAREMAEECGVNVRVGDLLYVTDRFRRRGQHVVDMAFSVSRADGPAAAPRDMGEIDGLRMALPSELAALGFSEAFARLVEQGFPGRGSYRGDFHAFYGTSRTLRVLAPRRSDAPDSGRLVGAGPMR